MTYWNNEPYYGLGAGAHGYHLGERHINIKGVQPYIDAARNQLPRLDTRPVEASEAMEDFMMVGLRMLDGVTEARFRSQFPGVELRDVFGETIDRLVENGLLQHLPREERYKLTDKGVPLGNEVFGASSAKMLSAACYRLRMSASNLFKNKC